MAELTVEQVLEFFNKSDSGTIQQVFNKITEGSESARQAMSNWTDSVGRASSALGNLKDVGQDALQRVEALANINFGQFVQGLSSGNKELLALTAQAGLLLGTISGIKPDAFNAIGEAASQATGDISRTFDILNRVSQIDPTGFGDKLLKGLAVLHEASEPARRFETGLMAMAARSGEFGSLIAEVGTDLEGLESKLVSFTDLTYSVAQVSGLTTVQVAKYASELNKIPGAISETIETSAAGTEHMHLLDAAIKVAAGTGQEFSSVLEQMSSVYQEFGTAGKNALEYVSRLAAASQALKMPLDLVKGYVTGASQSFRFFGDNSQAAVNILGRFGPALQESGLGPKAIADLTQNVTRNIAEMSLAQRAFLSGSSGGAGGLQGAYQIEQLKRDGKIDEVQKMVETSLRQQFGGRIVTLDEAAKDQGLAAQFTKQVQLLTQGPTKIASSEAEAYSILEAMSKGTRAPQEKQIASREEALSTALDIGNSFQERNFNQLTAIANTLDLGVQYSSIIANNTTRTLAGTGFNQTNIEASRFKQGQIAAGTKMLIGESSAQEQGVSGAILSRAGELGSIKDTIKQFENTLQDATKIIEAKTDALSGSAVNPRRMAARAGDQIGTVDRISGAIAVGTEESGNVANRNNNPVLTVQNVTTCPLCQKNEMTKTAEVVFDGRIEEVKKGEVKHIHTGANLK